MGQGRALSNSMPRFGILPGRNCALRPFSVPSIGLQETLVRKRGAPSESSLREAW